MARARNIKPGIFKNEVLGVADPLYTLLFEGLWLLADRAGRLENRPLRIKAEVFPYREGLDIVAMLGWLEAHGFVRRYQCGGLALIQVINFEKHQSPHKNEPESIHPPPEPLGTTSEEIGSARADCGLLIPDSGLPALQPKAEAPPAAPARPKRKKTHLPENFHVSQRVADWAARRGFDRLGEHLEAFKRKANANGYTYADWDDAFMEAIREDWAKLRGRMHTGAAPPPERVPGPSAADSTAAMLAQQAAHAAKAVAPPANLRELAQKIRREAA